MNRQRSTHTRLLAVSCIAAMAAGTYLPAKAAAQQQSAAQQACTNASNKGFGSVAKAQGKLIAGCIKSAAAGKLSEASVEDCTTADTKGKVAKAAAKSAAKISDSCGALPPFGPSDASGTTATDEGVSSRQALIRRVLGNDLDAAVITAANDAAGASCQGALVKALDKCWNTYVKSYGSCAKKGIASTITDAAGLGACRGADPKGKIAKTCVTKFQAAFDKACAGQDPDLMLPGCPCQGAQPCSAAATGNAANTALEAVANLTPELVTPQIRVAQADTGETWLRPATGEPYVATWVRGRYEDSPLECYLGAMNIQTVIDEQADNDYNSGLLPLLFEQGVRLLFRVINGTTLTPSAPPNLLQPQHLIPLYNGARDFLNLATRAEVQPLAPVKYAGVGDTVNFGFQQCLHNCVEIGARPFPGIFGGNKLLIHSGATRSQLEDSVAGLASEAAATTGVTLDWVGLNIADPAYELEDGTVGNLFTPISTIGTVIYTLDPGVDPATQVLTLPNLSALVTQGDPDNVIIELLPN